MQYITNRQRRETSKNGTIPLQMYKTYRWHPPAGKRKANWQIDISNHISSTGNTDRVQKLATTHVLIQTPKAWEIRNKGQQNTTTIHDTWKTKWQTHKRLRENWGVRTKAETNYIYTEMREFNRPGTQALYANSFWTMEGRGEQNNLATHGKHMRGKTSLQNPQKKKGGEHNW